MEYLRVGSQRSLWHSFFKQSHLGVSGTCMSDMKGKLRAEKERIWQELSIMQKKKIACPKEWCVWLYSLDGVQHAGQGLCQTEIFLEVRWGLAPPVHLWQQVTWSAGGQFPPGPSETAWGFVLWSIWKRPCYSESFGWETISRRDLDWWYATPSARHGRQVCSMNVSVILRHDNAK